VPAGCRFASQAIEECSIEACQVVVVIPERAQHVFDAVDASDWHATEPLEVIEQDGTQPYVYQ